MSLPPVPNTEIKSDNVWLGWFRSIYDIFSKYLIVTASSITIKVATVFHNFNRNGATSYQITNNDAGTSATAYSSWSNGTQTLFAVMHGTGHSGGFASQGWLYTNGTAPLILGTANTARLRIEPGGTIITNERYEARLSATNTPTFYLTRGISDVNFQIRAVTGDAGAAPGTVVGRLGLAYDGTAGHTAGLTFYRGAGAVDSSIGVFAGNAERVRLDSAGWLVLGSTSRTGIGSGTDLLAINGNIGFFRQLNASPGASNPMEIVSRSTTSPIDLYPSNVFVLRAKPTGQIRLIPLAADPAGLEDGDIWYNSTAGKFRGRAAGVTVDFH